MLIEKNTYVNNIINVSKDTRKRDKTKDVVQKPKNSRYKGKHYDPNYSKKKIKSYNANNEGSNYLDPDLEAKRKADSIKVTTKYKGKHFDPNFHKKKANPNNYKEKVKQIDPTSGQSFDPFYHFKNRRVVNKENSYYNKHKAKSLNPNYKGKNFDPFYHLKGKRGSKKKSIKDILKDRRVFLKKLWAFGQSEPYTWEKNKLLINLSHISYMNYSVRNNIIYYWAEFLGIDNYKKRYREETLYVKFHTKLRLLKDKSLNKVRKYLAFIENIYTYVSMDLLDLSNNVMYVRYAYLIYYLIGDISVEGEFVSPTRNPKLYNIILLSIKKIHYEYYYELFGNVKENFYYNKSIDYYLEALIILFENKKTKDKLLQEKGFKSISDLYLNTFWKSVMNGYVKGPMSLCEYRSRNYISFRLDDWKEYIASRKEKFKSVKSIFYKNKQKTIRYDQHILLSKAYPFLKRNLEIKYHRFIYEYTRKLGAAKPVLNIKNILIEYLVDKVSVNAFRIKKNITRHIKELEGEPSLVTPQHIVKLSERYTYYPRKEYVSKKEKELRDGFVREYYEEFESIISQEYIKDKAYRRYTNSTNRSIIIRKKQSKNYSLKAWWLRPLVKDYYLYNKRIQAGSSLVYKNYLNTPHFVKSVKKVSNKYKEAYRFNTRWAYQANNVVDFGLIRKYKGLISNLVKTRVSERVNLYRLMYGMLCRRANPKKGKPKNIISIKNFLKKISKQKLMGDFDSTYYQKYREYKKQTGWVSYAKRNETKNLKYLYNCVIRLNPKTRKEKALYQKEQYLKWKKNYNILARAIRMHNRMIKVARWRMVFFSNNSYDHPDYKKYLSKYFYATPYKLSEMRKKQKALKMMEKAKLLTISYKVLLTKTQRYVDKNLVQNKNLLKKRKIMHNMLFNAL